MTVLLNPKDLEALGAERRPRTRAWPCGRIRS